MRLARVVFAVTWLAGVGVGGPTAQAVTLSELVALSRAGLADEVLIALVEVDARVFPIDAETIKWLHDAGVSPRVIEAIVRSGRPRKTEGLPDPAQPSAWPPPTPLPPVGPVAPPDDACSSSAPPVVVVQPAPPPVVVAVPVYVAAPSVKVSRWRAEVPTVPALRTQVSPGFGGRPVSTGFGTIVAATSGAAPPPPAPVYWGWGGRLRPDAWTPAPEAARPRR